MARKVTLQDVELHRRLLQQLYKDSLSFHDIFFKLSPAQKMSILAVDREVRAQRQLRNAAATTVDEGPEAFNPTSPTKKLSAVTVARMEQKKEIQQLLLENNFNIKQIVSGNRLVGAKSAETKPKTTSKIERKTSKTVTSTIS